MKTEAGALRLICSLPSSVLRLCHPCGIFLQP